MSWEIKFSNSKQLPYFYNSGTKSSVWEPPAELSPDQIQALPGIQYLTGRPAAAGAGLQGGKGSAEQGGAVRGSHILAKHSGSRRPSSWRTVSV